MPLHDHFHPPIEDELPWEVLHSAWAPAIATALNGRWLPRDYVAHGHAHFGPQVEIDVATYERTSTTASSLPNGGVTTLPRTYAPPAALASLPAVFPDTFEVRIFTTRRGRRLVAAIELVSPGNKDRPSERRAFVAKCASYLQQGVSLVLLDVVTDRHFNLHNDLLGFLQGPEEAMLAASVHLYAASYRPVARDEQPAIDVWAERCELGAPLPTMPMRLIEDLFVPVEFESTYLEVCRNNRLL